MAEAPAIEKDRKPPLVRIIELQNGGAHFEDLVSERLADGMSVRDIASEFQVHWTSLYGWIELFGIQLPERARATAAPPGTGK